MYLALYRKYRPVTFDDVISQPHITTTLKNQIKGGKHGHAYLFTGSRGTGKTTCAKILSMAVNCLNPKDGNPCMECAACREIAEGSAVDIVEMDAASNNGVNDVRILRDEVAYTPVSCKYRVYIIDEVHMMSVAAFNALLKTIEEPPAHVIFILATTELHKVPATIVSRCQRFEFRRINIDDSAKRLMDVAANEGISLEWDAAELIARLSDGGMRDALSVLDRCIAAGGNVTTEVVRSCAGVSDNKHLFAFSEMVAKKHVSGCLNLLQQLHNGSKDLARLIDELSGHYRDLMLYKTVPEDKSLLTAMPDEYPELERLAGLYSLSDILHCLELLQKCADGIGRTRHRKTAAEMTLIRMCLDSTDIGAGQTTTPAAKPAEEAKPAAYQPLSPEVAAIYKKVMEGSKPSAESAAPAPIKTAEQPTQTVQSVQPKPVEAAPVEPMKPAEPVNPEIQQAPAAPAFEQPPLPEYNSTPAAAEDYLPPLPDAPPEEYIPQREFDTAPPVSVVSAPAKPVEEDKPQREIPAPAAEPTAKNTSDPQPQEQLVPKAERLDSITPQFWEACVETLGGMMGNMLSGSTVKVNNDGVLEITSDNLLLHNQVKIRGYQELESAVASMVGKKVHCLLVDDTQEQAAEDEPSAVSKLLHKAKQLGIEVEIK